MNFSDIKKMAEAYADITGRPLATLTVTEFITIAEAVSGNVSNNSVPVYDNTGGEGINKVSYNGPAAIQESVVSVSDKKVVKNDKSVMLQLLRSVKG